MKKCILILFLLASGFSIYGQQLLDSSSSVFSDIYYNYLENGNTVPVLSFPLFQPEIDLLRNSSEESDEGNADDGSFFLVENAEINLHAFFNDRNIDYFSVYDFLEKKPLAVFGFGLSDMYRMGLYIEAFVRSEYSSSTNTNLFDPKSGNPFSVENYFIQYGYVWYNFDPLMATFGRIPVHFGHPEFSSLLPSNKLPYMDSLYIKLPVGFVTMNMMISSLENREAVGDVDPTAGGGSDPYEFENNSIMTALHRFDMNWGKFSLSASGFSVISRQANNFNLADFFPVFSWHTSDVGWHNLSIIFEAAFSPFSGFDIYAQAGYDDINAGDLLGIDDTGNPTIDAYIAGLVYKTKLHEGLLSAKAEVGYTHYLWGNFYDGSETIANKGNHVFERAIYRYQMDFGPYIMPLTSPYGPGSFWAEADAELADFYGFAFDLNMLYLEKINGVNLIDTPYERNDDIRADNGVTRSFDITLTASWSPFEWLEVSLFPGILFTDGETDFHFDAAVSYKDKFIQKLD